MTVHTAGADQAVLLHRLLFTTTRNEFHDDSEPDPVVGTRPVPINLFF